MKFSAPFFIVPTLKLKHPITKFKISNYIASLKIIKYTCGNVGKHVMELDRDWISISKKYSIKLQKPFKSSLYTEVFKIFLPHKSHEISTREKKVDWEFKSNAIFARGQKNPEPSAIQIYFFIPQHPVKIDMYWKYILFYVDPILYYLVEKDMFFYTCKQ